MKGHRSLPGTQPTERQREVLECIRAFIRDMGWPPTLREIAEHLSIRSTNGVNDHLIALEKKGLIKRERLKARGIRVLK